ncbi:hypothetical protein BDZ45DRAFT_674181 [Acephala macrosclerotiorum]|nr:hypothetical protein BDZ45DRAFT_674181 [Acephala macrosclerotiorum]
MANPSASESHDEECVHVREVDANDSEKTLIRGIPSQTVGELKEAIANTIGSKLDEIFVAFGSIRLSDNDQTLSSHGIGNGDAVYFARSVTPTSNNLGEMIKSLFFKNFEGKTFNLTNIPSSWTIGTLQKRVGLEQGYEPEMLRFLWYGKSLESEKTLESYSIKNESTLYIVSRMRGGGNSLSQGAESRSLLH